MDAELGKDLEGFFSKLIVLSEMCMNRGFGYSRENSSIQVQMIWLIFFKKRVNLGVVFLHIYV